MQTVKMKKYVVYSPTVGYYAKYQPNYDYSYCQDLSKANMYSKIDSEEILVIFDNMCHFHGVADTVIKMVKIESHYELEDLTQYFEKEKEQLTAEYLKLKETISNIPLSQDPPAGMWKRYKKLEKLLKIKKE